MLTNNFLGCYKLETGGLVIGWLSLISDVLGILFSTGIIVVLSIFNCQSRRQDLKKFISIISDAGMEHFDEDTCKFSRTVLIVLLVIIALIGLGFAIISFLCIKGVENRDHARVRPMMIVCAIMTPISFLGILSFTTYKICSSIIYGVIYGYSFVVLYSLFDIFEQEYIARVWKVPHGRSSAQYQLPMGKA